MTGHLKTFNAGKKININAQYMRPSTDPHEPYFHLAEVMTVHMMIERGMVRSYTSVIHPFHLHFHQPPAAGQAPQQNGNASGGQGGASAYTSQARVSTSQYAGLPHLQRNIMEFLINQPPNDEGVHVGTVARGVSGADASQIR